MFMKGVNNGVTGDIIETNRKKIYCATLNYWDKGSKMLTATASRTRPHWSGSVPGNVFAVVCSSQPLWSNFYLLVSLHKIKFYDRLRGYVMRMYFINYAVL